MTVVFNTQTGTFPDVVYHPVFGARTMRDANEVVVLGPDWFNTAEEADLHRTQAEAELVTHNNTSLLVKDGTEVGPVVRNSVTETEAVAASTLEVTQDVAAENAPKPV